MLIENLNNSIIKCKKCPRLVKFREKISVEKRKQFIDQTYWGKPITGFGDVKSKVLLVGLAPAAHGGNRTGRVFTGDKSSDFLYKCLYKAKIANQWDTFFHDRDVNFVKAINGNTANHWLNAIIFDSKLDRDEFLKMSNNNNVMTRPIWRLMSKLPMFNNCQTDGLENSLWLEKRLVNIPSSVPNEIL